jgi:hypothetical protein
MPEETTVKVADLEAANKAIEELKRELAECRQRLALLKRAIELMTQAATLQNQITEEVLLLKEHRDT